MSQVSFMPYYPNQNVNDKYGKFHLWNWHKHKNDFLHDAQELAFLERYFGAYKRSNGDPETRIAIIEPETPFAQVQSIPVEVVHFAAAAMLAHLSRLPMDPDAGFFASVSDNFDAYHRLFDPTKSTMSVEFGSYHKTLYIGSDVGKLTLMTPQHMPGQDHGVCDTKLFHYLAMLCGQQDIEVERLFRALEWVGFAFSNAPMHLYPSRLVAITTAFEILLDLPENDKSREFSERVNARLLRNQLPQSTRSLGYRSKKQKQISDNVIGWWCRDLYALRSKIVHGDKLQRSDFETHKVENLKIALYLLCECVDALLVQLGVISELQRIEHFWWYRQDLLTALGINRKHFY